MPQFYTARLNGQIMELGTINSRAVFMKALKGFAHYLQTENIIKQEVLPNNVMPILEQQNVQLTLHQASSSNGKKRPLDKLLPDDFPKARKNPQKHWPADFDYGRDRAVKAWLRRRSVGCEARAAVTDAGVAELDVAAAATPVAEALPQNRRYADADPDADVLYDCAVVGLLGRC